MQKILYNTFIGFDKLQKKVIKMNRNRVVLHICDMDFPVATDNPIDYVKSLGESIDGKMREILSSNSRMTFAQAAVLTALEYADEAQKNTKGTSALREQLSAYLADSEDAKLNLELMRRENESLKAENNDLRKRLNEK